MRRVEQYVKFEQFTFNGKITLNLIGYKWSIIQTNFQITANKLCNFS